MGSFECFFGSCSENWVLYDVTDIITSNVLPIRKIGFAQSVNPLINI